jgi:hypothetical protein
VDFRANRSQISSDSNGFNAEGPGEQAGSPGSISVSGIEPRLTDPATFIEMSNSALQTGSHTSSFIPVNRGSISLSAGTISLINPTIFANGSFGGPGGSITFNTETMTARAQNGGEVLFFTEGGFPAKSVYKA